MKKVESPCFDTKTNTDCKDRCVGCSTLCALWQDYVKRRDEEYKQRAEKAQIFGAEIYATNKRHNKILKKQKTRR